MAGCELVPTDYNPFPYFTFAEDKPFPLESGATLRPVTLAYETYGALNEDCSNAILLEEELDDYPNQSFDYVILSQTLPFLDDPEMILSEMLRLGRQAVVSFPNWAFWR